MTMAISVKLSANRNKSKKSSNKIKFWEKFWISFYNNFMILSSSEKSTSFCSKFSVSKKCFPLFPQLPPLHVYHHLLYRAIIRQWRRQNFCGGLPGHLRAITCPRQQKFQILSKNYFKHFTFSVFRDPINLDKFPMNSIIQLRNLSKNVKNGLDREGLLKMEWKFLKTLEKIDWNL